MFKMNTRLPLLLMLFFLGTVSFVKANENINNEGLVEKVTDANFEKIVLSEKDTVVIVDFWAPWCGPCRRLSPVMDKLSVKYKGKIKFVKLNTQDNGKTPAKYGIRSIPNVKFFKNGLEIGSFVGALPQAQIEKNINKILKKL